MYDILELNDKLLNELKEIARLMSIANYDELRKQELIYKILDQQALNPTASNSIRESLSTKFSNASPKVEFKEAEVSVEKSESASSARPKRKRVIPGEEPEAKKAPVVLEPSIKIPSVRTAPPPKPIAPPPVEKTNAPEQPARSYNKPENDRFFEYWNQCRMCFFWQAFSFSYWYGGLQRLYGSKQRFSN